MKRLEGRKILLGVSGSIAAYKAAFFVRLLRKEGAELQVVMTPSAAQFVSPLTFSVLSQRKALVEYVSEDGAGWNNHVALGLWAELMIVAPASAHTISGMATGRADNLLLATYLSARCPVMIAPAMDLDMYRHDATQSNLRVLRERGHLLLDAEYGELASGLIGEGRLAEPEKMLEAVLSYFNPEKPLRGKKVIVTAGPTIEAIDPVRYISNFSSGKMGFELARALKEKGAEVVLIKGPTALEAPPGLDRVIEVGSALEMFGAAKEVFADADIFIAAAAVADFRPKKVEKKKIKKDGSKAVIELEENPDIIASLAKEKRGNQWLAGFALESHDAVENAKEKIRKKGLDFIILNSLEDEGAGFQGDSNKITIIDKENNLTKFELKPKREVAADIVQYLIKYIHA